MKKNKTIEPMCKNCRLFDEKNSICKVIILLNGERMNLPVSAEDICFFENEFVANNEKFKVPVQEVKFWVENPKTGEKTDGDGRVKIEYPEGFFGKENDIN